MHFSLWLWSVDAVRALRGTSGPASEVVLGLVAALFRAFALTLVPAFAVGGVLWLARLRRDATERPSLWARAREGLRTGSTEQQTLRSGALLAAIALLAAWIAVSIRVCEFWIVGMARPQYAAMACVASCGLLLLTAAGLWPAASTLGTWLCRGLQRVPGVGARWFTRFAAIALGLAIVSALGVALVAYRLREPLAFLPWSTIGQVTGALVAACISSWLARRSPVRAQRARQIAGFALVLVSLLVAARQSPLAVRARQIAEHDSLAGRLGQAGLLWLLDRDHDGYLPGFAGGDCAPYDALRNPGAGEIPGNGIDEDCDGRDETLNATAQRGKYDYPVPAAVPARPPIVLITVDAFAARHMGALGYGRGLTPHMDALAARSAFFRRCFAQGPSTRLSFPSIFTSRWDTQIEQVLVGRHPFPIAASERMLAEVLQQAGYDTTAVLSDAYFSPQFWRGITRGFAHIIESPFRDEPHLPHDGPRVTDAAIAELQRSRDKPLFLWVHYYDAHSPHQQPSDVPVFGTQRKDVYDAELNLVDREVGRLLAAIEAQSGGQALVLLTGDHGIAFDEPRHATFNYGYDLSTAVLHVPLIVHAPFIPPRAIDDLVSTMDIVPTLANLLRLRGPLPYEGMSLVPEILRGEHSRPPELMHQFYIEERKWKGEEPLERVSLRTDRFNLAQDRKSGSFELYDYRADYDETHDLALDPIYASTLAALRRQLTSLLFTAQPPAKQGSAAHVSQAQP